MAFVRGGAALAAGVATFYFVGWFGAAILSILLPAVLSASLAFLGSAACGVLVVRRLWTSAPLPREVEGLAGAGRPEILESVATGALVLGGIGFCAGFFGPMVLAPDSNQGPLLGIFITGPLGLLAGAVAGYVRGLGRRRVSST